VSRAPSRWGLASCILHYTRYEYKCQLAHRPSALRHAGSRRRWCCRDRPLKSGVGLHRRRDPPVRREAIMRRHASSCFRCRCRLARGTRRAVGGVYRSVFMLARLAVCGFESIGWIVCQPKTLTVLVPRNPLLEPPTFRAEPEARRLGRGRGGSQDVGLAPVRARKDGHGG
jgi:hypothetical protein